MIITIKANESFTEAISIAFSNAFDERLKPFQFQNLETIKLRRSGKDYIAKSNKITVIYRNGKWEVAEFKLQMLEDSSPKQYNGDFELLEDFKAIVD